MLRNRFTPVQRFALLGGLTAAGVIPIFAARAAAPETEEQRLLESAYQHLKAQYQVGAPLTAISSDGKSLKAYQLFQGPNGNISIEVHRAGTDLASVWICAPRKNGSITISPWYQYAFNSDGQFALVPHQGLLCPPYPDPDAPPPPLCGTWDWSGDTDFGTAETIFVGKDPPHWSPILVGDNPSEIRAIHGFMQARTTQPDAVRHLDSARPRGQDLTDRVMNNLWPKVTLRGFLKESAYAGSDFALHHTTDYWHRINVSQYPNTVLAGWIKVGDLYYYYTPHGGLSEAKAPQDPNAEPDFPGLDWDMTVQPDPEVRYLASYATHGSDFSVEVETEHFAIPTGYRPIEGEWLQTIGRWVIDCGHPAHLTDTSDPSSLYNQDPVYRAAVDRLHRSRDDLHDLPESHTEIHPAEMLVSSAQTGPYESRSIVIATGAFSGGTLDFVVYAPPRPSPTATLHYQITDKNGLLDANGAPKFDRKDGTDLQLVAWPPDNPNHLVGHISATNSDPLLLYNTGMVGMTPTRGLQCYVWCWWDEPSSRIEGTVRSGDVRPATGARLYYRDADTNNGWQIATLGADGSYHIEGLKKNGAYSLRPAGSSWSFRAVPQRIAVTGGTTRASFSTGPPSPNYHTMYPPGPPADFPSGTYGGLKNMVVSVDASPGAYGVHNNSLGYAESEAIYFHLAGLNGNDDRPLANAQQAVPNVTSIPAHDSGPPPPGFPGGASAWHVMQEAENPPLQLQAHRGPAVSGAVVHARLLLGNRQVGYQAVSEATARTNDLGVATFRIVPGSNPEDAVVLFDVQQNPYNPWFKPTDWEEGFTFLPAKTGDDFNSPSPYRIQGDSFATGVNAGQVNSVLGSLGRKGVDFRVLNKLNTHEVEFLLERRESDQLSSAIATMLKKRSAKDLFSSATGKAAVYSPASETIYRKLVPVSGLRDLGVLHKPEPLQRKM